MSKRLMRNKIRFSENAGCRQGPGSACFRSTSPAAAGLTLRGLILWRSALGRRLRCVRLFGAGAAELAARLQRSAQTAAASQLRSALRAPGPRQAATAATEIAPTGSDLPQPASTVARQRCRATRRVTREYHWWRANPASAKACAPRRWRASRGVEKRRGRGLRAQRASSSDLRQMSDRSVSPETCREFLPRGHGIEHRRAAGAQHRPPR